MSVRLPDGSIVGYGLYGDPDGEPVFFLHGFPGSRLSAELFEEAARRRGVRVIAPDRPGIGLSTPKPGRALLDYPGDVARLADALGIERFAVLGLSGGGPYAAACAFALPERLIGASIVCGLGPPETPDATRGMTLEQRFSYEVGRRVPRFAGWFLQRVAGLAQRDPARFFRMVEATLPDPDRRVLARPEVRENVVQDFLEAFAQGWRGVAEDLALLLRPWGFPLGGIRTRVQLHHGELDRTVPVQAGRYQMQAIPGCEAIFYAADGHFSLPADRADEILGALAATA